MKRIYYVLLLVLSVSCTSVKGTLTEAEGYFISGEIKASYQLAAFTSAKANMPIGVLDRSGQFYLLAVNASEYDSLIYEQVKMKGKINREHKAMLPTKVWYFDEVDSKWKIFR